MNRFSLHQEKAQGILGDLFQLAKSRWYLPEDDLQAQMLREAQYAIYRLENNYFKRYRLYCTFVDRCRIRRGFARYCWNITDEFIGQWGCCDRAGLTKRQKPWHRSGKTIAEALEITEEEAIAHKLTSIVPKWLKRVVIKSQRTEQEQSERNQNQTFEARKTRSTTADRLAANAQKMRGMGYSARRIGNMLGRSERTIYSYFSRVLKFCFGPMVYNCNSASLHHFGSASDRNPNNPSVSNPHTGKHFSENSCKTPPSRQSTHPPERRELTPGLIDGVISPEPPEYPEELIPGWIMNTSEGCLL